MDNKIKKRKKISATIVSQNIYREFNKTMSLGCNLASLILAHYAKIFDRKNN